MSVRVRFTNLPGRFEILETSLILETFPQSEGLTKKELKIQLFMDRYIGTSVHTCTIYCFCTRFKT